MREYFKKHVEWIKRDPGEWLADYYFPRVFLFLLLLTPIGVYILKDELEKITMMTTFIVLGVPIFTFIFWGLFFYLADDVNQSVSIDRIVNELSEIKNLLSCVGEKCFLKIKKTRK